MKNLRYILVIFMASFWRDAIAAPTNNPTAATHSLTVNSNLVLVGQDANFFKSNSASMKIGSNNITGKINGGQIDGSVPSASGLDSTGIGQVDTEIGDVVGGGTLNANFGSMWVLHTGPSHQVGFSLPGVGGSLIYGTEGGVFGSVFVDPSLSALFDATPGNHRFYGTLIGNANTATAAASVPATGVTAGALPASVTVTSNNVLGKLNAGQISGKVATAAAADTATTATTATTANGVAAANVTAGALPASVTVNSNNVSGKVNAGQIDGKVATAAAADTATTATTAATANGVAAANVTAGALPASVTVGSNNIPGKVNAGQIDGKVASAAAADLASLVDPNQLTLFAATNADGIVAAPDGVFAIGDSLDVTAGNTSSNGWSVSGGYFNTRATNYANGIGTYFNGAPFSWTNVCWMTTVTNGLTQYFHKNIPLDNSLCVPGMPGFSIYWSIYNTNIIYPGSVYSASGTYTQYVGNALANGQWYEWTRGENDTSFTITNGGGTFSAVNIYTWNNANQGIIFNGIAGQPVTAAITGDPVSAGSGNWSVVGTPWTPPLYQNNNNGNQCYPPMMWIQANAPINTGKRIWLIDKQGGNDMVTFNTTNSVHYVYESLTNTWYTARRYGCKVIAATYPFAPNHYNALNGSSFSGGTLATGTATGGLTSGGTNVLLLNALILSDPSKYDAVLDFGAWSAPYSTNRQYYMDDTHWLTPLCNIYASNALAVLLTNKALRTWPVNLKTLGESSYGTFPGDFATGTNGIWYQQGQTYYPALSSVRGTNLQTQLWVTNLLPLSVYKVTVSGSIQANATYGFNFDIQATKPFLLARGWINQQYYTSPYQLRDVNNSQTTFQPVDGPCAPTANSLISGPIGAATGGWDFQYTGYLTTGMDHPTVAYRVAQFVDEYTGNVISGGSTYSTSGTYTNNSLLSGFRWYRWVPGPGDTQMSYTGQSGLATNFASAGIQEFLNNGTQAIVYGTPSGSVGGNIHQSRQTTIRFPALTVERIK